MDNTIEKRIQSLNDRLSYTRDIFAGKHEDSIRLLDEKLTEFTNRVRNGEVEDPHTEIVSLEDLFVFVEKRLEKLITPMDRVRIVRHPQRICLRDILENVYDNFTEVGGQDEHSLDPSMLIARAVITRRRGKKMHTQSVMVIGQEKGHGAEFRNGGSVKPWGNAKALQYMRVAETEGIPIHCYIFTPGSYPIEDYPGAAQQMTPTTVDTIMPYISQFSKKNPDVNFEVHDGITYSLYQYLLDGIIDISVARTPLRLDEVSYMELCSEPMIAVSAPENTASSLKLADLLHRPLILYRRYEELIMNTFHAQNMNPDIFCVCDDPRGAMLWAKENLATAIFPQSMASLCDGLCIQELDEPDLVTKILLIWAKGKKPVPLVQEFLDVCGEH